MQTKSPEEIQARAVIAAALIQSGHIGATFPHHTLTAPWSDSEQFRRLRMLTERIYEAITSEGP